MVCCHTYILKNERCKEEGSSSAVWVKARTRSKSQPSYCCSCSCCCREGGWADGQSWAGNLQHTVCSTTLVCRELCLDCSRFGRAQLDKISHTHRSCTGLGQSCTQEFNVSDLVRCNFCSQAHSDAVRIIGSGTAGEGACDCFSSGACCGQRAVGACRQQIRLVVRNVTARNFHLQTQITGSGHICYIGTAGLGVTCTVSGTHLLELSRRCKCPCHWLPTSRTLLLSTATDRQHSLVVVNRHIYHAGTERQKDACVMGSAGRRINTRRLALLCSNVAGLWLP